MNSGKEMRRANTSKKLCELRTSNVGTVNSFWDGWYWVSTMERKGKGGWKIGNEGERREGELAQSFNQFSRSHISTLWCVFWISILKLKHRCCCCCGRRGRMWMFNVKKVRGFLWWMENLRAQWLSSLEWVVTWVFIESRGLQLLVAACNGRSSVINEQLFYIFQTSLWRTLTIFSLKNPSGWEKLWTISIHQRNYAKLFLHFTTPVWKKCGKSVGKLQNENHRTLININLKFVTVVAATTFSGFVFMWNIADANFQNQFSSTSRLLSSESFFQQQNQFHCNSAQRRRLAEIDTDSQRNDPPDNKQKRSKSHHIPPPNIAKNTTAASKGWNWGRKASPWSTLKWWKCFTAHEHP